MNERKLVWIRFKHPGSDLHRELLVYPHANTPLSTLTLRWLSRARADNIHTQAREALVVFVSIPPDLTSGYKAAKWNFGCEIAARVGGRSFGFRALAVDTVASRTNPGNRA